MDALAARLAASDRALAALRAGAAALGEALGAARSAAAARAAFAAFERRSLYGGAFIDAALVMGQAGFAREVMPALGVCRAVYGDAELLAAVKNTGCARGRTLLMHAAHVGDLARLRALLAAGADVNTQCAAAAGEK